MTELIS